MERTLVEPLDHRRIDTDVLWFRGDPESGQLPRVATVENIARFAYEALAPALPSQVVLTRIHVQETENNSAEIGPDDFPTE